MNALDPSVLIEGIAFDAFGSSEQLARQASSTVLAIYTIVLATAVTIGGIIYDFVGWQGMSAFHVTCQTAVCLLFLTQRVVYESFKEVWFKHVSESTEDLQDEEQEESAALPGFPIVATQPSPTKEEDLQIEDIEDVDLPGEVRVEKVEKPELTCSRKPKASVSSARASSPDDGSQSGQSGMSAKSATNARPGPARMTGASAHTCRDALSVMTGRSGRSYVSAASRSTAGFQFHFAATTAVLPTIAQRTGEDPEEKKERSKARIPPDLKFPLVLIVLCFFNNHASYLTEFSTFAIFFKQYHGWESATWASLAQTSGDLMAAVMMKLVNEDVDTGEKVGIFRRLTMQPYNLSCLLVLWMLCNFGMISPWLPLAIFAQVAMGTVFVYTVKMATDLNLFYSLGDSNVYLSLQVYCKNAEALGGCAASFFGPFLFDQVSPFFPFVVSTCLSGLIFLIFTTGFCRRIGCLDIEAAEAQRSQSLGVRRVSSWKRDSRASRCSRESLQEEA